MWRLVAGVGRDGAVGGERPRNSALTLHGGGQGFESPRLHFENTLLCRINLRSRISAWMLAVRSFVRRTRADSDESRMNQITHSLTSLRLDSGQRKP